MSKLGSGGLYTVDESTVSKIDVIINGDPAYQAAPGTVFVLK